jgi:NADH-quinone oxidoreductase subunit N
MSAFLFSLAGIPPLGGWYAKLVVFNAVLDAGSVWAVTLGVIAALNSVIALFYYAGVSRMMWFREAPDGVATMARSVTPPALGAAMALPVLLVLGIGVYPQLVARIGELASLFSS